MLYIFKRAAEEKRKLKKNKLHFIPILFSILCIGTIFLNTSVFVENQIFSKWLFAFAGLGGMGLVFSVMLLTEKKCLCKISTLNAIIVFLCALQAGYGVLQFGNILPSVSGIYKVTGSFDNPAGFAGCLCGGLPFTIYFLLGMNSKRVRWYSWFAMFIIVVGILMSESRAGLLCIVIVAIVHFICCNVKKLCGRKAIIEFCSCMMLFLFSTTFLFISVYQWKKDSADGRLLIWECTWEMIKDKPIIGHGIGAFEAHYMNYQADYFRKYPDSEFAMLADNVKHLFNEFLSVGVQFGALGWILLIILCVCLFYCYKRRPSPEGYTALLVLLSVAVFSMFSYPFSYPFTWIVVVWCVGVLIAKNYGDMDIWNIVGLKVRRVIAMILIVISLLLLYGVTKRTVVELEWRKISRFSLNGQTQAMLPRYDNLLADLGREPYFLYNYAAELCVAGKPERSLKVAAICCHYWSDYDLELLQAEAYISIERFEEARNHLEKAALMCPVRFIPLYRLHYIYKEQGDKEKADSLARFIVDKPVKVKSAIIRKIKKEMRSYLDI